LWESGHGGNSAHVVLVSGHPDESAKSPVSSPGVLDDPVVISRCGVVSPSNGEHSVVKLAGGAVWLNVDSAGVELEGRVGSINGNGGWSQVNLGLEVRLRSGLNVGESSEGSSDVGWVEVAGSILSSVWVAGFSVNSVVADDVLHGLSHESSIASLVSFAGGAVNKVLLRDGDHLVLGQKVASLSGSSGGKGPA